MDKKIQYSARSVQRRSRRAANSEKVRFGLVGAVNTVVDFVVLNVLVGIFGVMIVPANIVSTTAAMLTSFGLNKKVVFKSGDGSLVRQLVLFFAVTLSAIWVVQSGVMFAMFHILSSMTDWSDMVLLNIAKLFGIGAGLVWNYIWYSRVVFRQQKTNEK